MVKLLYGRLSKGSGPDFDAATRPGDACPALDRYSRSNSEIMARCRGETIGPSDQGCVTGLPWLPDPKLNPLLLWRNHESFAACPMRQPRAARLRFRRRIAGLFHPEAGAYRHIEGADRRRIIFFLHVPGRPQL